MAIVFLTHAFPPLKYAQSIQIARFVKYSRHDIRVICCDEDSGKDDTIAEGMNGRPAERYEVARRHAAGGIWGRVYAHIAVPDQYRAWAFHAADAAVTRSWLSPNDLMVTFGEPMSMHLAGLKIKQLLRMPWVAHFSDPWADNPHRRIPLVRWLNRSAEARVVDSADRVIFTSEETRDLVMRKYPSRLMDKSRVLPHSFDPTMYGEDPVDQDGIVLRYIGNFYGRRKPDPFVRGVQHLYRVRPDALKNVSIEFVGGIRRIPSRLLAELPPSLIRFRPPVDYKTSLGLMKTADLLLVIDAPFEHSVFLPSKLVDYIGAGRPMFAVTPPGTSAKLVSALGGLVAHPAKVEEIAEKLGEAIRKVAALRLDGKKRPFVGQEYAAPVVVAQFDSILEELSLSRRQ